MSETAEPVSPAPSNMPNSRTISDLCEKFNVSRATYNHYHDYYHNSILPRIRINYLAHLVSSVEELIDEKLKSDRQKIDPNFISGDKAPKFFIILRPDPPPGKYAAVECFAKGAFIKYKPSKDFKRLRIFIAHELGHVLRHYKVIQSSNLIENHANLFAFIAIHAKDRFYKTKIKDLLYDDEGHILRTIEENCPPIDGYRQMKNS